MMTQAETWTERVNDGDEHAELFIDTTWGEKHLDEGAIVELKRGALKLLKCAGFHVDAHELRSDRRYPCPVALRFERLDGSEKDLLIEELVYVANSGVGYGHCSPVLITTYADNTRGACITCLAYARILKGRAPVLLAVLDRSNKRKPQIAAWEAEAARLNVPTGELIQCSA